MGKYRVLGIMSGSSLDGLDICLSEFSDQSNGWSYNIKQCHTVDLPSNIKDTLLMSPHLEDLSLIDKSFGRWIGEKIVEFIDRSSYDLIGIHGHTVIHKPQDGKSIQIGSGREIAQITNCIVIDNFRQEDIMKGGQGAPLVPMGEKYLFSGYDAFLNLGGICNVSIHNADKITAWDVGPCNQVLNFFANQIGKPFDENGDIARKGTLDYQWLTKLNSIAYFRKLPPKSIGNDWVQRHFFDQTLKPEIGLHTFNEFLGYQTALEISNNLSKGKILITGGGAYNKFFIERLRHHLGEQHEVLIPSDEIIEFKEALIFGFLALLKKLDLENVLASVTGASSNTSAGDLHVPSC